MTTEIDYIYRLIREGKYEIPPEVPLGDFLEESKKKKQLFLQDVKSWIDERWDLVDDQIKLLFDYAWLEGHSGGYSNILSYVLDLTNLMDQMGVI